MSKEETLKPKRKIQIFINRRKKRESPGDIPRDNTSSNPAESLVTLKKALLPREPEIQTEADRDILEDCRIEVRLEREVAPGSFQENLVPINIRQRNSSVGDRGSVTESPAPATIQTKTPPDRKLKGEVPRKNGADTGELNNDSTLQGRYRVMGLVKQDQFRRVYLGMDDSVSPSKPVKIIQLRSSSLEESVLKQRNDKLGEILRKLTIYHHPHLSPVTDAFIHMGRQYYVVDYIRGRNILQIMKEQGGALTEEDAADVGIALCDVLGFMQFRKIPFYLDQTDADDLIIDNNGVLKLTKYNLHLIFDPRRTTETIPRKPDCYFDQVNWIIKIVFYLLTGECFRGNINIKKTLRKQGPNIRQLMETLCQDNQKVVGDLRVLRKMLEKAPIRTRKESKDIQKFAWKFMKAG